MYISNHADSKADDEIDEERPYEIQCEKIEQEMKLNNQKQKENLEMLINNSKNVDQAIKILCKGLEDLKNLQEDWKDMSDHFHKIIKTSKLKSQIDFKEESTEVIIEEDLTQMTLQKIQEHYEKFKDESMLLSQFQLNALSEFEQLLQLSG